MKFKEYNPKNNDIRTIYHLMISGIAPRPIALVGSYDDDDNYNLAPFSFFNGFGANPPIIGFSPALSGRTGLPKDTLINIEKTKEFTVSVVTSKIIHQTSLASCEFDSDVDEFIKNTKLASKITKSEDGTSMSIVATISGSAEISAADLDSYVSAIESQWTGTYSDDNGKQLSLTVDLQIVESGGDISVLACAKCGYSLNENRQLRLIRGIALQGGNKMWYSKQYSGKYTAGHEFGHVLGFDHIGTNQLMSSGGGGGSIRNPSYSTIKTLFENY